MSTEESMTDYEANKVVLLGDEDVGKTSMFLRFKTERFVETTSSTKYQAEHYKEWAVNGTPVRMKLFDTAGMERHCSTIPPTYFREARAVIMMYSLDSVETLTNLISWMDGITYHRIGDSVDQLKIVLVGNKSDLVDKIDVQDCQVREIADVRGIPQDLVYKMSVLTGEGFDEMFDSLALSLSSNPVQRRSSIKALHGENTANKKSSCSSCSKK
jgi:small GTP-binding protein